MTIGNKSVERKKSYRALVLQYPSLGSLWCCLSVNQTPQRALLIMKPLPKGHDPLLLSFSH